MKKKNVIAVTIIGLSLFGALLGCGRVWADGYSEDGASSSGSGATFSNPCSGVSTIISENCGSDGGGKSWRIYKTNTSTKTVKKLNKLNAGIGAKRVVVDGYYNQYISGGTISNVLKTCAEKGTPYVMLFGFNEVKGDQFFVMYNRVSKDCNSNRGCYYNWNNTNALTSVSAVTKLKKKNGRIVYGTDKEEKANTAWQLYHGENDFKNKSFSDFQKVGAFCTWGGVKKVTLKAYAVDEKDSSGFLRNSDMDSDVMDYDTVESGDEAFVVADDFTNYSFQCWSSTRNCNNPLKSEDPDDDLWGYTKKMGDSDVTVYAVYKKDEVTLSGKAVDTKGNDLDSKCNPNPKTVTKGENATIYSKGCSGYKALGWSATKTGTPSGDPSSYTEQKMQTDKTVYIIYMQIPPADCPAEYGISTPSSYTNSDIWSGETSTATRVKNDKVGNAWTAGRVYAKPTDTVSWGHCYFPGVQTVADTKVTTNHKADEVKPTCSQWSSSCTSTSSYTLTSKALKNVVTWENKYTVQRVFSNTTKKNWSGTIGNAAGQKYEDSGFAINAQNVGNALEEKITTGKPIKASVQNNGSHSWDCAWGYKGTTTRILNGKQYDGVPYYGWTNTCKHNEDYISYSVTEGPTSSSAKVLVPYNFENKIEIEEFDKNNSYFFAGESDTVIKSKITVGKRKNNTTDGEYATKVDGAKAKVQLCYNGGATCYETNAKDLGTLNNSGNMGGATHEHVKVDFNIPDFPAGTEVCLKTAVYPKDSYSDTNIDKAAYNVNDNNSWAWSESVCVRVAKRPSIQVVGGNIYSAGKMVAGLSVKNLLDGFYTASNAKLIDTGNGSSGRPYTFGSWGELGIIASNGVKGFASGSTLGYASNNNGTTWPDPFAEPPTGNANTSSRPGGGNSNSICNLSPLTISQGCSGDTLSGTKTSASANGIKADLSAIQNMIDDSNVQNVSGSTLSVAKGAPKNYYKKNGNLSIGSVELVRGSFVVINVSGTATITQDIKIGEEEAFAKFSEIPKLVIYAGGNINISCDVSRLDAILVSSGTVTTCYADGVDFNGKGSNGDIPYDDNKNLSVFAKQLTVNGAIVANKLVANRTYGAAKGANSIVPAEYINFDPTLYLWGGTRDEAGAGNNGLSGDLQMTYLNELAPRY